MDVVFLTVVPVASLAVSEGETDAVYLNEKEEELQCLHNRLIDTYFSPNSGILIESRIIHGDPAEKIVRYADEIGADLVAIGSRGRSRLASVLLGSVSEQVAKHSKRSVLIVKKRQIPRTMRWRWEGETSSAVLC